MFSSQLTKQNRHLPTSLILQYPPLRIGVIHGHQIMPPGDHDALAFTAQSMDVDMLLSGSTHCFEAYKREGRFYLNPGSATGAWTTNMNLSSLKKLDNEKKHGDKRSSVLVRTEQAHSFTKQANEGQSVKNNGTFLESFELKKNVHSGCTSSFARASYFFTNFSS